MLRANTAVRHINFFFHFAFNFEWCDHAISLYALFPSEARKIYHLRNPVGLNDIKFPDMECPSHLLSRVDVIKPTQLKMPITSCHQRLPFQESVGLYAFLIKGYCQYWTLIIIFLFIIVLSVIWVTFLRISSTQRLLLRNKFSSE